MTNIDKSKQLPNYAMISRGFRLSKIGVVAEQDDGTIHRFASYPECDPVLTITNITDDPYLPIIVTTSTPHYFLTGDWVRVYGTPAGSNADGIHEVTWIDAYNFELGLSNRLGVSGGTSGFARGYTRMVSGETLYLQSIGEEHEVVAVLDRRENLRVFVEFADYWIEMTTKFTSTISYAPAANTFQVDVLTDIIDTVKVVDDVLAGMLVWNVTKGSGSIVVSVDGGIQLIEVQQYVDATGLAWEAGDTIAIYAQPGALDGFVYAIGLNPHIRFVQNERQDKVTMLYGIGSEPPVMQTPVKVQYSYHSTFSPASIATQEVIFFPSSETWRPTLFLREADAPVDAIWYAAGEVGDLGVTVLGNPAPTQPLTTTLGWSFNKAQMNPNCKLLGTPALPHVVGTAITGIVMPSGMTVGATEVEGIYGVYNCGEGIALIVEPKNGTKEELWYSRIAVTILYRGTTNGSYYQESDPIFIGNLKVPTATGFPCATIHFCLDPVQMNTGIAGFRVYMDAIDSADVEGFTGWIDNPEGYLQVDQFLLEETTWEMIQTSSYPTRHKRFVGFPSYDAALAAIERNLFANLNHAPDKNRSYLKSRYAAVDARQLGTAIVMDDGDGFARISAISGSGTHMDDSFPDVTADKTGRTQLLPLSGRGELLGIAPASGMMAFLRSSHLELYDMQSGQVKSQVADVEAPLSICDTPFGLVWLGTRGFYIIPIGSSGVAPLAPEILNLMDGSLEVELGVPYLTHEYRKAAVGGYDQTTGDYWCNVQMNVSATETEYVCLRYHFGTKRVYMRKLAVGYSGNDPVQWFSRRKDGTFTIGYANGLLRYPYRNSTYAHTDDVVSTGLTAGNGFLKKLKINFGQIYANLVNSVLVDWVLNITATSISKHAKMIVRFYANHEPDPFDTQTVDVGKKADWRWSDSERGQIESLQMELEIEEDQAADVSRFSLSQIELGLVRQQRISPM